MKINPEMESSDLAACRQPDSDGTPKADLQKFHVSNWLAMESIGILEVRRGDHVILNSRAFEGALVDIAFDVIKDLREWKVMAHLIDQAFHFQAAAVLKFDRFAVRGDLAVANMMRAALTKHRSILSLDTFIGPV